MENQATLAEPHIPPASQAEGGLLSVVIPVYNEAETLPACVRRLTAVLDTLPMASEIVLVNDGSRDDSLAIMRQLHEADPRIAIVDLSRNFGKEIALSAGLDFAKGDAVVVLDADLQDPPELIPELVKHWRAGYDVVYGKRVARQGETWLKKATAYAFYRVLQKLARVPLPEDTGDFRLLSRRAVNALRQLREQHRFMKGLFAWIGYPQKAVPYRRDPRYAGTTKWSYWRLWNLAIEGITSFTIAPLKVASYLGLLTACLAAAYALFVVYKTLVWGEPVAGYPSLMVAILSLGAVQLLTLGIIGEYLGRIFNESKQRPLYFVKDYVESQIGEP
ncbi:MAG: glycosyl transferase family 2 [Candidatus Tectimicrobiota bacterium]|nr:MAG: glycosyl transferase family 2 [Candidatus Tectomicrobia bacterium]